MLRNQLYAGWVKSGELLVKGMHEAIVPQGLFDKAQEFLTDNSKGKGKVSRKAVRPDFPLKQFVRCANCGRGLTSGIRKKKSGKEFAYLWCYTTGCRAVSVRKHELETSFIRLLGILQPTFEYLNRLPEIAARQWENRKVGIEQEGRALKMRLTEQKSLDSQAIKANLRGKLSDANFQTLQNEIKEECQKIEDALKALEIERKSLLEAAQKTKLEHVSFVNAWRSGDIQKKIELQKALFPDGLVWSHENGYLDRKNRWLIEDLLPVFQEFTEKPISLEKFLVKFGVPDGI